MDCGVFVGCCNLGGNDVDPEGPAPQVRLTFMVDLSWPCLIAGGYIPISYPYWGTLIYPAIGIYGPSLRITYRITMKWGMVPSHVLTMPEMMTADFWWAIVDFNKVGSFLQHRLCVLRAVRHGIPVCNFGY